MLRRITDVAHHLLRTLRRRRASHRSTSEGRPAITPDTPSPDLVRQATDPTTPKDQLRQLAEDRRLAPFAAANPALPAAVLDRLNRIDDAAVRRAVARNPNAAPQTLLRLAPSFPAHFFASPALPLLPLEQPDLPLKIPAYNRSQMVQHHDAPPGFLAALTADPYPLVAGCARMHVNLAGEVGPDWETTAEGPDRPQGLRPGNVRAGG